MQQQNILQSWASQLLVQSPVLLALLLMLIMALVLWGRYPKPCLLAFLGSLLLLLTALVYPLVSMYVIQTRSASGSGASIGAKLSLLGLVMNVVRAAGYVLLTGAIFAGRVRPAVSAFPVAPPSHHAGGGPAAR